MELSFEYTNKRTW